MLPFTVQFLPGEPAYEQVLFAVKKAITAGNLVPGDRFPSVRSISMELKISPNTAHKVVTALIDEGVLTVQLGVGTVVAIPPVASPQDKSALLNGDVERLVVDARQLGLSEEQIIAAVRKHWRKF